MNKWMVGVADATGYTLHGFANRDEARAFRRKVVGNPFLKGWSVSPAWRIR